MVAQPLASGPMTALTWPDPLPEYGPVRLRPFAAGDLSLVAELAADPYIPLIGTVPATFTAAAGLAYLERQHQRLRDGLGWSFAIADRETDRAVGGAGLWLNAVRRPRPGTRWRRRTGASGYATAAPPGVDRLRLDPTRAWTASSSTSSPPTWPRSRSPGAAATRRPGWCRSTPRSAAYARDMLRFASRRDDSVSWA